MKKVFILSILVVSFLSSCAKEYICTCAITGTVKVDSYTLYNTKKKAIKNCNSLNSSTQTCVLEAY